MRTRLSLQGKTNVWEAEVHPTLEHALFRWLGIPVNKRAGGFVSDAARPEPRLPSYAEVNMGYLLVDPDVYARHKHRFTIGYSDPAKHGKIDGEYPRVLQVTLPWLTLKEREYQALGRERGVWLSKLDDLLKGEVEASESGRLSWEKAAEAAKGYPEPVAVVEEADWVEVTEADKTAREEATFVVRLPLAEFRRALGVCTDMGREAGRVYKAYCEDAREAVESFVAAPSATAARRLGRAASALSEALPNHFPGMDAAGVWAMISRPALRGMAEAAHAWAYAPPVPGTVEDDRAVPQAEVGPADTTPVEVAEVAEAMEASTETSANDPVPAVDAPIRKPVRRRRAKAEAGTPVVEAPPVAEPEAPSEAPASEETATGEAHPRKRQRRRSRMSSFRGPDEARAVPVEEAAPEAAAEDVQAPAQVRGGWQPTLFDQRVIKAMKGRRPMRKFEIALHMGCGRGAVNRTIDRLLAAGYVAEPKPLHFALSEGRA